MRVHPKVDYKPAMGNEEARSVAAYLIVRRGPAAYAAALDHADRLKTNGHPNLAAFWQEIAAQVAVLEAHANRGTAASR